MPPKVNPAELEVAVGEHDVTKECDCEGLKCSPKAQYVSRSKECRVGQNNRRPVAKKMTLLPHLIHFLSKFYYVGPDFFKLFIGLWFDLEEVVAVNCQ